MGRFDDRATRPARGPADLFRWRVLDRLRGASTSHREAVGVPAPHTPNDGAALHDLAASLTWIGHASFALRLGGKLVVVDPIWSTHIHGVVPRFVPPGVAWEAMPKPDVVLITHNHYDHLDLPTLQRIGPGARYVVPMGLGALLRRNGLHDVVELDWWATALEGALACTLVPARHWSMRAPWDRNDSLWGGWVLRGPEGTAYHAGDTAYFDGFAEIGRRCGPIDWAMLPIGAYAPRWFMEPQHMDPEDSVRAFGDLGSRVFVAMHWGTFKLTDEPLHEPPETLQALWEAAGRDPSRLWVLAVGETRPLVR
jgi:L-ascorbate metabolism protein UlaG (beta-lactamase superfamily)